MKPFHMALFLLAFAVAGCRNASTQVVPIDRHIVDSAECAQFANQVSEVLDQRVLEDDAAYKRQREEFNNLTRSLNTSGATEKQMTKETNDLAARQDIENEAREDSVADQLLAIRQHSQKAGCTNLN